MKIVLSGVETNNKGAELMLYAILQEIERRHPEAVVYISRNRISQGLGYVSTPINFRYIPCEKVEQIFHLPSIFNRLKVSYRYLPHMIALGKVDFLIDSSGFLYSDQFNLSHLFASVLERQLSAYRKNGTEIVLLPQAFGPFEKKSSKEVLSVLSNYANVLMPRERISMRYVTESGVVNMEKVRMFTDFTSLVVGVFPVQYNHLRNGICIIPNKQMINKGAISMEDYLSLLKSVIDVSQKSGRVVYLLNHEGKKDEELCAELNKELNGEIEYVTGLNALEVKGLIASAYLVISSRFHGVASSLNSCVPCLATSWSHKYKELFNDYGMDDCVLPLDDVEVAKGKITEFIHESKNKEIRNKLYKKVPIIKEETRRMWDCVWSY